MSGHAPGPWRVEKIDLHESGDHGTGIAVIAADGTVVCDNQTYYPERLDPKNAPVIAAAPDLLKACKALKEQVEAYSRGWASGYVQPCIRIGVPADLAAADAAIDKAEGR